MDSAVTLNDYKLSCELLGHSMDVRAVTENRDGIISGSRDKTVKMWKKEDGQYREDLTLSDHSNFISCVCYLEEEEWICTGSNDSTICIYREGCVIPFAFLRDHKSTVCAIRKGLQPNTLISGSWDQTGRVWKIEENGTYSSLILKGHEAAVWAVASTKTKKYVTGSADKYIFLWNTKGEKLNILKGHKDCVRDLLALEDGTIVSCSNDGTLCHWNENGQCLRELCGHENYIYTIALNKCLGNDVVVSGGEDSTIRMWSLKSGNLGDSITLPAQSIWSVACLKNGDIVTGSSDGVVRVFTKNQSRFADPDKIKSYNLAVESRKLEANEKLGGIKRTELPGPESLLQPGKEGQTKMIRYPDGKVKCFQWENNKWSLIGDVMGASGGTQDSSGKTLFEGKEYDFVFSVDISDNAPPLKLPYNRGEDPWHIAQNFIHKNNLPQVYLDQVANFIIKNSDTPVIQHTNSSYEDPFTGGSRYIPGSSSNNISTGGNVDPFTGGSSYTTNNIDHLVMNTISSDKKHFPQSKFHTFDKCDSVKILDKLREFNAKIEENKVSEEFLQAVIKLADKDPKIDKVSIEALLHLLQWPKEILFPVLDIARLAVRSGQIYALLNSSSNFLDILIENLNTTAPNQLMCIRGIANIMRLPEGQKHVRSKLNKVVEIIAAIKKGSVNLQIAIATLYFNCSASQIQFANSEECRIITEGTLELLKWCVDLEALYRAIQCLGNLTCTPYGTITSAQIISVDYVMDKIRHLSNTQQAAGFEKVTECAKELLAAF